MDLPQSLLVLARRQRGVVSRAQCLLHGLPPDAAPRLVEAGRWQRIYEGVYCVTTGPLTAWQRLWAGVLWCGEGAVIAGRSALWSASRSPGALHEACIAIPPERRVVAPPGLTVIRRGGLDPRWSRWTPPVMPAREAILDVTAAASDAAEMVNLVCTVVREGIVRPATILKALEGRARHPYRRELKLIVDDVAEGAQSNLEVHDLRNDRRHGLPVGKRQVHVRIDGKGLWRDVEVRVPELADGVLIKELDGRLGHEDGVFRDRVRDNFATLSGRPSLRFGWEDEFGSPCGVAAVQVHSWWQLGWQGRPRLCGSSCRIEAELAWLAREFPLVRRAG